MTLKLYANSVVLQLCRHGIIRVRGGGGKNGYSTFFESAVNSRG
jgi:hypothetical protein